MVRSILAPAFDLVIRHIKRIGLRLSVKFRRSLPSFMRAPAIDDRVVTPEGLFRFKPPLDIVDPALNPAPLPAGVL
jgi:hypothetical protein